MLSTALATRTLPRHYPAAPAKMKVTAPAIAKIQMALSTKGMNQSQLAEKVGWHRGNVSKLLKGGIDTMSDEMVDKFNDALGIDLEPLKTKQGNVSRTVLALSDLAEKDVRFAGLLETFLHLAHPKVEPFLPQVDTKRLPKIGAKITEIVHQWEEGQDPHYSKIAVEVLDFLRNFYAKAK